MKQKEQPVAREKNILKRVFLGRYDSVDFIIRTKVTGTLYLAIVLFLADIVPVFIMLSKGVNIAELIFRISAVIILLLIIFLIKKGFYRFATNILLLAVIIIITMIAANREFRHYYEIYFLAYFLATTILISCLIGYNKYQPWLVAGLSYIIVIAFYLLRGRLHGLESTRINEIESLVLIGTFFVLSGFLGGIIMRNIDTYIKIAQSEIAKNQGHARELKKVISSVSEGMSIGDNLLNFAVTSKNRVQQSNEILKRLKLNFTVLAEKMTLAKNNNSEIAGFTKNVEDKTKNHAADIHESTVAIEEMNATIDTVSKISSAKKSRMQELQLLTENSTSRINKALESIKRITVSSEKITQIGEVIQNISGTTNLLAMNANIQATHAGVYGRGFMIVAKEIRDLAEQTSKNASEITKTLEDISTEIRDAENINTQASEKFVVIKSEVKTVIEAMDEVFHALSEIKSGITELTGAITGIRDDSIEIESTVKDISERTSMSETELKILEKSFNESSKSIDQILSIFFEISKEIVTIEEIGQDNIGQIIKVKDAVSKLEKQ